MIVTARSTGPEKEAVEESKLDELVNVQHRLEDAQRRIENAQNRFARQLGDIEHRESMMRARPAEPSIHEVLGKHSATRDEALMKVYRHVAELISLTQGYGHRLAKLEADSDG